MATTRSKRGEMAKKSPVDNLLLVFCKPDAEATWMVDKQGTPQKKLRRRLFVAEKLPLEKRLNSVVGI
ncbi:MAG: hypothetical protein AAF998_25965 [Bacteroidota bacterium]